MTFYNPLLLIAALSATLEAWLGTLFGGFSLFGAASFWVGLAFLLSGAFYARLCGTCAPLSYHDEETVSRLLWVASGMVGLAAFAFTLYHGQPFLAALFVLVVGVLMAYAIMISVYADAESVQVQRISSR